MAHSLSFAVVLGPDDTGLTLSARFVDTAGSYVGAAITTGFVERGEGYYQWFTNAVPDGFIGIVEFKSGATLMAIADVNPTNVEQWLGTTPPTSTGAAGAVVADTTYLNGDLGAMSDLTDFLNAYGSGALAALIADTVHRRTMTNVKASANGDAISKNSLYGFIQQAQKSATSATTLTVQNPDGSTLGTFTLSVDVNGLVTGIA